MTHDEAIKCFDGLTYASLNRYSIDLLVHIMQGEIMKLRIEIPDCALLAIDPPKYTAKQLRTGKIKEIEITVSGTYFSKREAVTFNENGWIGFCGWASGYNNEPFVNGFAKWCHALKSARRVKK